MDVCVRVTGGKVAVRKEEVADKLAYPRTFSSREMKLEVCETEICVYTQIPKCHVG